MNNQEIAESMKRTHPNVLKIIKAKAKQEAELKLLDELWENMNVDEETGLLTLDPKKWDEISDKVEEKLKQSKREK